MSEPLGTSEKVALNKSRQDCVFKGFTVSADFMRGEQRHTHCIQLDFHVHGLHVHRLIQLQIEKQKRKKKNPTNPNLYHTKHMDLFLVFKQCSLPTTDTALPHGEYDKDLQNRGWGGRG